MIQKINTYYVFNDNWVDQTTVSISPNYLKQKVNRDKSWKGLGITIISQLDSNNVLYVAINSRSH